MNSIYYEVRESFQQLILEVLSILPKYIQNKGSVPTREIIRVTLYPNGDYTEKPHEIYDLAFLVIRDIYLLESYKHCLQIVSENKSLRPHNCSYSVVLSSFVEDYLKGVNPETITFDQRKFDSIFEEYISALHSETFESVNICPLIGFESDIDIITLSEGLSIRKITPDELNEIWHFVSSFDLETIDFKRRLACTKYVIEHNYSKIKGSFSYPDLDLIPIGILALRLLKSGNFWSNRRYEKLLLPWKSAGYNSIVDFDNPFSNSYKYFLSREEIADLKRIYIMVKKFYENATTQKDNSVTMAISWFNKYFYEFNTEHRFIFLMFLMETLCSDGGSEIQFKLSNRISLIIGKDDKEMISIIDDVKELYKQRSKIVHGDVLNIDEKYVIKAEEFSRKLIKNFILFLSYGYTKKTVIKLVNDAFISKSSRDKLDKIVRS